MHSVVHGGAVVPDHHVANSPAMAIDVLRPRRVLGQEVNQWTAFRHRHIGEPLGVVGIDEQAGLPGLRMSPHHRVTDGHG